MHDDIPGEGDTEFQHEVYRKAQAYRHEIALVRIKNKHELRSLRLGYAHKTEIARALGSELRDTLALYSDGLLKFCTFIGPDFTARLVGRITDRTSLAAERIADAYFAGPCCTQACRAGADSTDSCAPGTDSPYADNAYADNAYADGTCADNDQYEGEYEDGGDNNEDDGDDEDDDGDDEDGDDEAIDHTEGAHNIFELRSGILYNPVFGTISGIDSLLEALPDADIRLEAKSLPGGYSEWLDPVAKEAMDTWYPLAEYAIRSGLLVGRGGVVRAEDELARFKDCLVRVSTRPVATRPVATRPVAAHEETGSTADSGVTAREEVGGTADSGTEDRVDIAAASDEDKDDGDAIRQVRVSTPDRD